VGDLSRAFGLHCVRLSRLNLTCAWEIMTSKLPSPSLSCSELFMYVLLEIRSVQRFFVCAEGAAPRISLT
jgi:hypothetical protein